MGITVLQTAAQAESARTALKSSGLGPRLLTQGVLNTLLYVARTRGWPPRPDWSKSWDVGEALRIIQTAAARTARIVDLGAFNSAIIPALVRLGFSDIVGVDLDPRLPYSPFNDRVRYLVTNMHHTGLAGASADIVTAISTIEHGWDPKPLLDEVSRILRPGGLFIASTDYWPDKIETAGVTAFGMSWTVFSKEELATMLAMAADRGLVPVGPLDFSADERVVHWSGHSYTFALIVLRRE